MSVWLYHINPDSPQRWTYRWDVARPSTLLSSRDKTWPTGNFFRKIRPGDGIAVLMKNTGCPTGDGVYIVGDVIAVDEKDREFVWRPDLPRTAPLLHSPIPVPIVRQFFGRGFGAAMQRIDSALIGEWHQLVSRRGDVHDGSAVLRVTKRLNGAEPLPRDPMVSREHGDLGERHIVRLLRSRYPRRDGYTVVHVAATEPTADHDIAVVREKRRILTAEVKTRVGSLCEPVLISERELVCRRRWAGRHVIFVVYLDRTSTVIATLELRDDRDFRLSPRQYWLWPGRP